MLNSFKTDSQVTGGENETVLELMRFSSIHNITLA
jgi:hypothetical protein